MTTQNGRAFNEWLRAQLKVKKMSQRQLAQQSGVDHSTISRLIRGDRMPSLGTATKLARGLRELRDDADTPQYLRLVSAGATNPTTRVEYALRAKTNPIGVAVYQLQSKLPANLKGKLPTAKQLTDVVRSVLPERNAP